MALTTSSVNAPESQPAADAPGETVGLRPERYQLVEVARGLASVMVLLFHSLIAFPSHTLNAPLAVVAAVTEHGWLGVHIFFAISGWCIAERFALARTRRESAFEFLRDRLLRIYPAYWAALAITIVVRITAVPFNTTRVIDNFPDGWRGWVGTWLLVDPYVGTQPYLAVSWSLVYELGFYFCAAVGLVALRWRRVDGRILFAVGALLCLLPWLGNGKAVPWIVLGLWPNFFCGVAAWCAVRQRARLAGFGVMFALALLALATHGPDMIARLAAVATAAILALLHPLDQRLGRNAFIRVALWFGTISYSLYLIHVPFISAWQNLAGRFIGPANPAFIVVWLTALAVAVAAGWALATCIELPLQRWRKRRRAVTSG